MVNKISILCVALLMVGCSKPMKNTEIIATFEMCKAAGMKVGITTRPWFTIDGASIVDVQCWPENEK